MFVCMSHGRLHVMDTKWRSVENMIIKLPPPPPPPPPPPHESS